MRKANLFLGFFGLLAITSLPTTSAHAQASNAYVSTGGTDVGTCPAATPCRSIQYAISTTSAGGVIACLESGNYGALITIAKSITIDCAGVRADISATSSVGFLVNAGANDRVVLRNLQIYALESSPGVPGGFDGIRYIAGGELEVDNVVISGMAAGNAGINVDKAAFGILSVRNSSFSRMNVGIRMKTTSGNIVASVTNTSFNNLTNTGIEVNANSYVGVSNSVFSAIYGYGINAATSTSTIYANDNVFTNNNVGMSATVIGAKIGATGNKFFGNSKSFNAAAGATFLTGGDNKFDINPGSVATGGLGTK